MAVLALEQQTAAERIRNFHQQGLKQTEIAQRVGTSQAYVSQVLHPESEKARQKAYRGRPEVRERMRAYNRAYWHIYSKRPSVMEKRRAYQRAYERRPEVRERRLRKGRCPSCGHVTALMHFRVNHA